jgi:hypothetical protein
MSASLILAPLLFIGTVLMLLYLLGWIWPGPGE